METNHKTTMKTKTPREFNYTSSLCRIITSSICLALLALSPLQLLGQGVISSDSYDGVYLNGTFSPAIHNVTVNSGVTVDNSDSGSYAIWGDTRPWHLINNGSLSGDSLGVYFTQGGSVNNAASIWAWDSGIDIQGNAGAVINSGSITGYYYDGIYFGNGGSVNNLLGGTIIGKGYNNDGGAGVEIRGGLGLVNNSGTIQSYSGLDAIYMNQGGSVTNSGNIYGSYNGVNIYGGSGSVVNSGSIHGYNGDGVYMNQGGSVDNYGGIYGYYDGVDIYGGTGSVINHGESTIQGYYGSGVYMDQAGSVDNSGSIYGYYNGVNINGPGTVVNNGSIYGGYDYGYDAVSPNLSGPINQQYAGVYLNAGGVVVNNGSIYGAYDIGSSSGVYITGGAGYVTNSGYIYGYGADGVDLNAGGVINNTTNGFIGGSVNGVLINGPATVVNDGGVYGVEESGGIFGNGGAGIYLTQGGSVANSGVIYGYYNGVEVYGAAGSVVNSGNITGGNTDGVYMDLGGSVTNRGTISGGQNGVAIVGDVGTVYNNGNIIGTNRDGVYLGAGGTVYNDTNGIISGGLYGVEITNSTPIILGAVAPHIVEAPSYIVENYGSISGATRDGVRLRSGGNVFNGNSGSISGNLDGVHISGGSGQVDNLGSIIGQYGDGVRLDAGGIVNNGYFNYYDDYGSGTISGGQNGVNITGGNGDVYNYYGSITGVNNNGVNLGAGGSVWNAYSNYSGSISGGQNGVSITGGNGYVNNYVYNNGTITGTNNDGVYLGNGGTVYNYATISGGQNGVEIYNPIIMEVAPQVAPKYSDGPEWTVYNDYAGSISGVAHDGVWLHNGGSVYNNGTISGGWYGVEISGGNGYVYNDTNGTINGYGRSGVRLRSGGTVDNYGSIYGNHDGVHISGETGTVNNYGTITGDGDNGIQLDNGGSVNNSGYINGSTDGIRVYGGAATIVNSGRISGGEGYSISLANYNNTVTLQTGSRLDGDVYGGTANDALILQGTGTDVNNFYNFETLTVQADAWDGRTNGWNLTGNSTFTTNTTVESGLLRVNGTLTTPLVLVLTNGVLGGAGTIVGTVDNHGIMAPGNSPGTLTIIGSLTNGSDYHAQVNADWSHDLITVSDTATITGGDVVVQLEHKVYGSSNTVAILTATNGVTGTYVTSYFDTNTAVPIFLTQVLTYDTNNVYLTLNRSKFASVAKTYNQKGVAGALDGIVDSFSPGMSNLVTEFFWLGSASEASAALDSMSGEIHGTLGMLDVELEKAFNQSVLKRTARMNAGQENGGYATRSQPTLLASAGSTLPPIPADKSRPFDIWLQGFGTFGQLGGDGNALGGNYTISGMNGGFDYRLSSELLLGLAVGYSHNNADVGGPGASGNVDAIQIAAYGGYLSGPWRLDGIFSYGFLQTSTKRQINVGPIHQQAEGSYDGGVFSVSAEGGYAFEFGKVTLEPTLGVNYAHLSQNSFNETGTANDGNNYGLNVRDVGMDSFRSAAGLRLAAKLGKKDGVKFIPELRVAWEHEFADNTADVTARFVGGSGDFNTRGVELGSDTGVAALGLTVVFNKAIQASVDYDARMNERLTSHAISGRVSYSW